MHSRNEGDERIDVLEGEIVFVVQGDQRTLRAGESLMLTQAMPHTFWNPSRTTSVHCLVHHGARFERAIAQRNLTRMAMFLTFVAPGASGMARPLVRGVLALVAWFDRLRGLAPAEA